LPPANITVFVAVTNFKVEIMKSESNKIDGYLKNEEQTLLKLNKIITTLKPYLKVIKKIDD